jgi:hypothetical protein
MLSQAICNGKKSWNELCTIPLTTQEDANHSEDTTKQTDKYSCHFQTTDATTGLHHCHMHYAYHKKIDFCQYHKHIVDNQTSKFK